MHDFDVKMLNPVMSRRSIISGAAVLGSMVALAGCSGGDAAADSEGKFKLGVIGPLTGDNASYGTSVRQGVELAVKDVEEEGGDVRFSASFQDDEADSEKAVNAYGKLMEENMQVLIGAVTTGSCVAVASKSFEDRVFQITPSATSQDVTAGKDNVFQVCFTDPNQGKNAALLISEKFPDAAIAVVYRNDDAYSQGIRDAFVEEAGARALNVVADDLSFTEDTQTDFSVQLTTAQNAGATMIFAPIYYTPASVLLTQAKSMGYDVTVFGSDGMDGILGVEGFDPAVAEGTLLLTPFSVDDPKNADFVSAYEEAYGAKPDQFAADAYDCVSAVKLAIGQAGATPDMPFDELCDKLAAAMTEITLEGLTGTLTWSENGEVSKEPTVYMIQDGKYVAA